MTLFHSVDFIEYQGTGIADLSMQWSVWSAGVFNGLANSLLFLASYNDGGVEQLRAIWMPGGWIYEQKDGARVDLYSYEDYSTPLVVNGSRNIHPAFLTVGTDSSQGLLAYQSDLDGSYDIYLLRYPLGSPVKVTHFKGWAGSPTWYPKP